MRSICVFLGSNSGRHPAYAEAARSMGQELAARNINCIYGGSDTGLMKVLADSVLSAGGRVTGVTVQVLREKEIFHPGLSELHVVSSMHERKNLMAELSDGFVALPGGVGTLDEFFEIYAWTILGLHAKPFGLLDVNGYYAPLDAFLDNAEQEGFLKAKYRQMVMRAGTPAELLERLVEGAREGARFR